MLRKFREVKTMHPTKALLLRVSRDSLCCYLPVKSQLHMQHCYFHSALSAVAQSTIKHLRCNQHERLVAV